MKYISGTFGLNINCELDTFGDWHCSELDWEHVPLWESEDSIYGDYGIERDKVIPEHTERYNVANHIRSLLDLISIGNFGLAQGMNDIFICNEKYDEEVFSKVYELRESPLWDNINAFMQKEYLFKWDNYVQSIEGITKKKKKKINDYFRFDDYSIIDEISDSDINRVCQRKAIAFAQRDRVQDLYDLIIICENYWDELDDFIKNVVQDNIFWKGFDFCYYIIQTRSDESIDKDDFTQRFIHFYDKLGLER